MPATQRYLTSLQKSFSTFLTQNYVTGNIARQAESLYLKLLGWKKDYTTWSVEEIKRFLVETQLNTSIQPQVSHLLTQFVKEFPPHQANIFLHEYLLAVKHDGCSSATVRNYRSDIRQYVRFSQTGQLEILFTKPKLAEFVDYQLEKGLKESSITRKISSISQFGWWLQTQGLLNQNLEWINQVSVESLSGLKTKRVEEKPEITPVVTQFKPGEEQTQVTLGQNQSFGLKKKLRELTNKVKPVLPNQTKRWLLPYLNLGFIALVFLGLGYFGYRQLFVETSSPFAYPTSPTRPNRVLSFQGRLTDTAQNPITTSTNMRFYLYDALSGGSSLWDSTACSVTPDQDGIFTVNLGDDCGSEISSDVFSENSNVWLEAIVESETLTPRQPIQTVAYAINAETVQGYPIDASGAATINTIVTMNDAGDIILGEVSPSIQSVSGTFTLEGEALTLQTASGSDGDVTIDPDGIGGINLLADITSTGYFSAPGATLSATYAGGTPLTVKSGPSATANIMEWQQSDGTVLGVLDENGYIGIGNSNPGYMLEVDGSAQFDSNVYFANGTTYYISNAGNAVFNDIVALDTGNPGLTVGNGTTGYLKVGGSTISDAAGDLTLDSDSGEVYIPDELGIGTNSPGAELEVSGTIIADNVISQGTNGHPSGIGPYVETYVYNNNTGRLFAYDGSSYYDMAIGDWNSGNPNIMLKVGGNVGVGVGNPQNRLDVEGGLAIGSTYAGSSTAPSNGAIIEGNVGIGDDSPDHTLDVAGNIGLDAGGYINWGDTDGESGYGFRDNSGTLQYRDSGGSWAAFGSGGGGTSYWKLATGALSPINDTLDLLVGGSATSSAKAGFINIDSGTPTASVSAGVNGGAYLTADGKLASTALQSLVLGDSTTTGHVIFDQAGNVGIGTSTPNDLLNIVQTNNSGNALDVYRNLASTSTDSPLVNFVQNNASDDQTALYLQNDGSGYGLQLYNSGAGVAQFINQAGTGIGLDVYSNVGATANQALVSFKADNTAFDQPALFLQNDGTSYGINLYNSGIGQGILVNQAGTEVGLEVYSNVGATANQALVSFKADNTAFDQTALFLQNDGSGYGLQLYNSGTGTAQFIDQAGTGIGLDVYSNVGATANQALVSFKADNTAFDQTALFLQNDGSGYGLQLYNSGTGTAQFIDQAGTGTGLDVYSNVGATADQTLVNFKADNTAFDQTLFTLTQDGSGDIVNIFDGGTEAFTILNGGNVGINNIAPNYALDIAGNTNLSSGNDYYIDDTSVLNATTLGSGVVSSSLTTVDALDAGSITSGFGAIDIGSSNLTVGGTINFSGLTANSAVYTDGSSNLTTAPPGSGVVGLWQRQDGALSPANITDDLLLGGTATSSAKFAFINNIGSGTPTASISGNLVLNSAGLIQTTENQLLTLGGNTTGNIYFDANVGIGTNSPDEMLQIENDGDAYLKLVSTTGSGQIPGIKFQRGGWDTDSYADWEIVNNGDDLRFNAYSTSGDESNVLFLDAEGKVAIGKTGPTGQLTVTVPGELTEYIDVNSDSDDPQISFVNGTEGNYVLGIDDTDNLFHIAADSADLETNTAFTIDQSGRVGIGTIAPEDLLEVQGSEGNDAIITLDADDGDDPTDTWEIISQASGNDLSIVNGSTEVFNLTSAGDLQVDGDFTASGGDIIGANSDYLDIGEAADSTFTFTRNDAGTVTLTAADDDSTAALTLLPGGAAGLTLGGGSTTAISLTTDSTGDSEVVLPNDSIGVSEINDSGATPTDEYCLTYESTGGIFEWQSCGGGGGSSYWRITDGALSPINDTLDLLIGGSSTASAKIAFTNIDSGTPTLSFANQASGIDLIDSTVNALNIESGLMSFDTNNSRVGIGTTTPSSKLEISTAWNETGFTHEASGTKLVTWIGTDQGRSTAQLGTTTDNPLAFFTNNGNYGLILDTTGYVGINTTTPEELLHIEGSGDAYMKIDAGSGQISGIKLQGGDWDTDNYTDYEIINTDGNLVFNSYADVDISNLLYFKANTGQIGIGTDDPLATLDIRSRLGTTPVASISGNTSMAALVVDQSGFGDIFAASASGETRFVVKNNGNVGIGVQDPTSKLEIGGSTSTISNDSGDITINSASDNISFAGDSLININDITAGGVITSTATTDPAIVAGNGSIGYFQVGSVIIYDNNTTYLSFDTDDDATDEFRINDDGSITLEAISSSALTTEGTIYYDDDVDHLYLMDGDSTWHRVALDMTKYSSTSASIANQDYLEIAHNQNTNDLTFTAWFYNTVTSLWEEITDWASSITHDLDNEFNPEFTQKQKVASVTLEHKEHSLGDGADGAITVSSSTNINTTSLISGRSGTCSSGDAANYSVTALTSTTATLSSDPSDCIAVGDEVLLINLHGTSTAYTNVGNYETFEVESVNTNSVTFTTAKTKYYGDNSDDDTNLGTSTGTQRVMLQRVPNYTDVTVNASQNFYPSDYDGAKGGVMFFRATGTVAINGNIIADGAGYRGGVEGVGDAIGGHGGEAFCGETDIAGGQGGDANSVSDPGSNGACGGGGGGGAYNDGINAGGSGSAALGGAGGGGGASYDSNTTYEGWAAGGGGGGYGGYGYGGSSNETYAESGDDGETNSSGDGGTSGTDGVDSFSGGGGGGGSYGDANLVDLMFGSSGGAGGDGEINANDFYDGGNGGDGGGIIYIAADTVTVSGTVSSDGDVGTDGDNVAYNGGGGGGAGGSVKIMGNILTLGSGITATGGDNDDGTRKGGDGGVGRIAVGYSDSISGSTSPSYTALTLDYNPYAIYTSKTVHTPDATALNNISWTESLASGTEIQVQTRSGATNDPLDGSWESWKPHTVSTDYVSLEDADTHTNWSGTNATVAEGDVARNVNNFEDEDESIAGNLTKTTATSANGYAEATISGTDISGFRYLTTWVRSASTGEVVKLGFGESTGDEQEYTFYIDHANVWQKIYWDISDACSTASDCDGVTKLRLTNITNGNVVYFDNWEASSALSNEAGATISSTANEYLQYRFILSTTDSSNSPSFSNVNVNFTNSDGTHTIDANSIVDLNESKDIYTTRTIDPETLDYTTYDTGDGADGAITVSSSTNINTTSLISGRSGTCSSGDAANYSVTALTSTTATVSDPSSTLTNCIAAGDEVMLINLHGASSAYTNVGNWETLRVQSVSAGSVTFTTAKTKYYGDNSNDDTNLGTSTGTQRVMLQRVPNYTDVTVNASQNFYPSDYDGAKGGVMFFRATGTVAINGNIIADGAGYRGPEDGSGNVQGGPGGEAFCGESNIAGGEGGTATSADPGSNGACGGGGGGAGYNNDPAAGGTGSAALGGAGGGGGGGWHTNTSYEGFAAGGAGGGYGDYGSGGGGRTNTTDSGIGEDGGTNSSGDGAYGDEYASDTTDTAGGGGGGGGTYGDANLVDLMFGSSGGAGGDGEINSNVYYDGGHGGSGGGIVYVAADTVTVSGTVSSDGDTGTEGDSNSYNGGGGGGAGGSVKIMGNTLTLGSSKVTAAGGSATTGVPYGGAGGVGRVAVFYDNSISGSTSPTYAVDSTMDEYNAYKVFVSQEINTEGATALGNIAWTENLDTYGEVQIQTRSGGTANSTDGTWEEWKPTTTSTTLESADTHTNWSGTNATVAEGDVTRNITYYEDEDESTAGNITKATSSASDGYAEATISSTDISGYDYLSFWIRSATAGNVITFGFGESSGDEQEESINIDEAGIWQKVYWDISDIASGSRDGVTKLRFTTSENGNVFYLDNVKAESYLSTNGGSSITSTADDYIQYRAILSTTDNAYSPTLSEVSIGYTDPSGAQTVYDRVANQNNVDEYIQEERLSITTVDLDDYKSIDVKTGLDSVTMAGDFNPGTGADGDVSVTTDTNINTTSLIAGRTCADGGDAVNYNVTALTESTATLTQAPSTGCLTVGDEILLINLQGTPTAYVNVGNYETLRVESIDQNVVTFTTDKSKFYGDNADDDTNLGTDIDTQNVMLQRVPNYNNLTVDYGVNFYPDDWNGYIGGVMFIRAKGHIAANGNIHADEKGYRKGVANPSYSWWNGDGGESFCSADGGGDGGDGTTGETAGQNGLCGGGGGAGGYDNTYETGGTGTTGLGGGGGGGGGGFEPNTSYNGYGGGGGGGGYGTFGDGGDGIDSPYTEDGGDGGINWSGDGGDASYYTSNTVHTIAGGGGGGGGYGRADLQTLMFGSGGGGGGGGEVDASVSYFGGDGGDGGGIVYVAANSITVSGALSADGEDGQIGDGASSVEGSGGGGAGGSVKIVAQTAQLGTTNADGLYRTRAYGGDKGNFARVGGDGGDGRIAIYYGSEISGTTYPNAEVAEVPQHPYSVFISDEITTPNAADYTNLTWLADESNYGIVQLQTRSGDSDNSTDGTWEEWKPVTNNTNYVSLEDADTHTDWVSSGSTLTVAEGDITRDVNYFEDEDESTATNLTKLAATTSANEYAESRIAATDLTDYDFLTAWVYATQSGNLVKLGFGETSATEHESLFKINSASEWQKIYWDISHIPDHEKDEVRNLRVTAPGINYDLYFDNIKAERLLNTPTGSTISSTPSEYIQYRVILASSSPGDIPVLYNVQVDWSNGFEVVQTDSNTIRLYNLTGEEQQLRLDAVVFGADLAEWYTVNDQEIEGGDIVATTGELDSYGVPILKKASYADQKAIIGGISTRAGQELGIETDDRRLLGLVGRIPIKMDPLSPALEEGDYITASPNQAGLGYKASVGDIAIAQSFEDWTPPTDEEEITEVLTFIISAQATPLFKTEGLTNLILEKIDEATYVIRDVMTNQIINPMGAFSEAIIANLQAGRVTTDELEATQIKTNFLEIAGQSLEEFIDRRILSFLTNTATDSAVLDEINARIGSGSAELKTDLIKPASDSADLTLQLGEDKVSTESGEIEYAQLEIKDGQGDTLAKLNSQGEFTLLGELNANQASIAGELTAASVSADLITGRSARLDQLESKMAELEHIKAQTAELVDATVSGTLYATKIDGLDDQLADTLNQSSFLDKLLSKKAEASDSASLASLFTMAENAGYATDSGSLNEYIHTNLTSDVSLVASAAFINNYFSVNGSGYVAQQLGVGQQLLIGNDLAIGENYIEYQPMEETQERILHIQPSGQGTLSLMGGLMTLDEGGNVLIDGDLAISGNLEIGETLLTDLIEPTNFNDPLQIKLASDSGEVAGASTESRLEILGLTENPTATISAQGRGSFEGGIDIGTEDLTQISTQSATVSSQKPSGKATIVQGTLGITIKSALITHNSLIYVSPIGSTDNQVLYVKSQTPEDITTLEQEGGFSVGFDIPITHNITFNWWIVN